MAKFRKKPIIVDAIQWNGDLQEISKFFDGFNKWHISDIIEIKSLFIETLEGTHEAGKGDWIIKGNFGEFYPIKNEIFLENYEKVNQNGD